MKQPAVSRRQFLQILTALGGAAALTGCGSDATGGGSSAGTLTIGIADEPEGLDIQQIGWENYVHWLLYDPIVVYSDDLTEVKPCAAEKFEVSDDGKTYTITLPKDAKFSNGDTLDANAYKASLDRYIKISEYGTDYDDVESFEVVDDQTLVMHLKQAAPYLMTPLSTTYSAPVDTKVADDMEKDAFNREPVANGPYVVDSWEQGSQVTFKRNENFATSNPFAENKGPWAFDTIVIRFIPDEFTRVSEVESGNVDIVFDVPASSVSELKSNDDIELYEYAQSGVSYLHLNTDSGVLADAKVREALAYAIDRDEVVKALDDMVTPVYGFISEAQACYSADEEAALAKKLAYDPDKSKSLLEGAGWKANSDGVMEKNGTKLSFELLVPGDRTSIKNAAPVIQKQLKAVGFDAKITEQDASYIKSKVKDDDYAAACRSYVWLDPDILYSSFTPASGYSWEDKQVTELLEKGRQTPDDAERAKVYVEFQERMVTLFKALPLFADKYVIAGKKTVENVRVSKDGRMSLHDAKTA
ncbi:ABC transporter substrate-binding protein [Atopobiaceae bacterium Sow4_H2]